jgi:acetyl-CoA carboxylase carboxyltransferase component
MGGEKAGRQAQGKGQTDRPRTAGQAVRQAGTFREIDMFVTHRCVNFGMEKVEIPSDGVDHRPRPGGRPAGVRLCPGFYLPGGQPGRDARQEDLQGHGSGLESRGAPFVGLNDSGGARIQEGVDALSGYGQIFFRNSVASGVIPRSRPSWGPRPAVRSTRRP